MEISEILEELSSKPKTEIQNALVELMLAEKIDFTEVNKAYVECLKYKKDDNRSVVAEAGTCIMDSLFIAQQKKKLTTSENNIVQRNLYFLNNLYRGFNMAQINKDFNYIGDDEAKKLSWYAKNNI